jgi:hypothetical protein
MTAAAMYVVCMLNAKHSDGRRGDAYIGRSLEFSTLDPAEACQFDKFEAEHYAEHWYKLFRGFWFSPFLCGDAIEIRPATVQA